jgi:hypothetical protein
MNGLKPLKSRLVSFDELAKGDQVVLIESDSEWREEIFNSLKPGATGIYNGSIIRWDLGWISCSPGNFKIARI